MKDKEAARLPEIITDIYISALLLIYPLWVGPGGYVTITEEKYGFFKWTALIYLAVMLLIFAELLLIGKAGGMLGRLRHISLMQGCILLYVLFCCLSAAFSSYGAKVWLGAGRYEGLGTILLYAGIFLVVSYFGRFKKWYLYLLGIVILANTVIGILQYAGFNPFFLFPKGYTYHDAFTLYANAFMGTLGNIDLLSAFLSISIPLLYAYYVLHERSALLLIPLAAGIFLLLLTGVSAGVAGIGIGVFITIPLLSNSKQSLKKTLRAGSLIAICAALEKCLIVTYTDRITAISFQFNGMALVLTLTAGGLYILNNLLDNLDKTNRWDEQKVRRIMAVCVAAVLAAVPAVLWAYPFSGGTLSSLHQLLHGAPDPKLGSSRIQIWQQVIKLVPERLLFGGGPDTLAERLTFSFQRYNEATGTTIQAFIDTAHNDYLNILVNTGLFSLACYLGALVSASVRTLKTALSNKQALFIFTALLCYLIQIFFSFSICIVSPFFWIFLGLFEPSLLSDLQPEVRHSRNRHGSRRASR